MTKLGPPSLSLSVTLKASPAQSRRGGGPGFLSQDTDEQLRSVLANKTKLADLGVSVAGYELLLIVSLEPCGVVL